MRLVLVFGTVLLALSSSALGAEKVAPVKTAQAAGYVPERACATCHREIYQSFQHVGMGKSFYRPRRDNVIEDYENNRFYHAASDRHYEMLVREEGFFLRRWRIDDTGARYAELERRIDWIIGSGNHSRGYLHQTELGELFQLPLVWYTQKPGWGMAPGYDRADHSGFNRQINRECMFCHNAYPDVEVGSDLAHQPQRFPQELPEGIGCQRCHGPGEEHIAAMESSAPMKRVRETIVNPGRLPPKLRDDVCFQCHLQPISSRTSLIRRLGRPDYSYRPGEPLEDYLLHMEFDDGHDPSQRYEVNHHPYRLRQSRCYTESGGELNCLTCHDPHVKVAKERRAAFYRERCQGCHELDDCSLEQMQGESGQAPTDDCTACHMPERRPHDAMNTVMTDHLIRKEPAEASWMEIRADAEMPRPFQSVHHYFPERAPDEPLGSTYATIAAVKSGDPSGVDALRDAIEAAGESAAELAMIVGSGELRARRFADAAATFRALIDEHPEIDGARVHAATALVSAGGHLEALALLQPAQGVLADDPGMHYVMGLALAAEKRVDEAIARFQRAIELRPASPAAEGELGLLYLEQGKLVPATRHLTRAVALEPASGENYWDLGRSYYGRQEWAQAIAAWRRGVAMRPETAEYLVLVYLSCPDAGLRDPAAALAIAQRATEERADDANLQVALALTLLLNDRPLDALPVAARAQGLGGDRAVTLLVRSVAERILGRAEAAQTFREVQAAAQQPQSSPLRPLALAVAARVFGAAGASR